MVTICLQCGDEGFTNAYVFCVKCLEFAVHRYCLDKLPETYDEFVYWVCDDCEVKVPNELTLRNSDANPLENCTSPPHLKASSEAKLDVPPLIAKLSNGEIDGSLVKMVDQRFQPCSFKKPHEVNTQFGGVGDCSAMIEKGSILSADDSHGKESEGERRLTPQSRTALSGDASQSLEGELPKEFIFVVPQQAEPVYDPIWRGGFNIWNKEREVLGGLVAHLSVKACQKVFDEANLFPTLLHLEMLPKSEIWPKSFGTSEPADDNIALYFFPLDARRERDFDRLVEEMIGGELALRAIVTNAELLVFTSTELPLIHWRFQGKHYLWGVFRSKRESYSCQTVSNGVSSATDQTLENILAVTDQTNPVKPKTWNAESPNSPLSNNASLGSGSC